MKGEINSAYESGNSNATKDMDARKVSQITEEQLSEIQLENGKHQHAPNPPYTEILTKPKRKLKRIVMQTLIHILVGCYFAYAAYYYTEVEKRSYTSETVYADDGRCHVRCGIQFCNGFGLLLLIVIFVYSGLIYYQVVKPKIGRSIHRSCIKPFAKWWMKFSRKKLTSTLMIAVLLIALAACLYMETREEPEKLTALVAPCFFILAGYVFSTARSEIKWRTVIVGITCQFALGIICIRWDVGRSILKCVGDKVAQFLSFSDDGSRFIFGEKIVSEGIFAFVVLPVIFFFSFFISILYYLGTMQVVVMKLGWFLQQILGTTVCESVIAAANIFLGMTESLLLIRPYIQFLTASEIHSIMVSGFATVSGTVMAAYISFGASPAYLITSSVMAAPATIAMAKLFMPETEESKTTSENMQLQKSEDSSLLDAATNGANAAIPIVLGVTANIVAFVALISFLNAIVNYLGYLVGLDDITFEWIFSKLFIPLVWSMGVPWKDCDIIAKVVATKTIINEFIAYERLGEYTKAGMIEARSTGIATFAICGFANPSSLGILIGALGVMAPHKRGIITAGALRAFIVGSIVCFMSASFVGILLKEDIEADVYSNKILPAEPYNITSAFL